MGWKHQVCVSTVDESTTFATFVRLVATCNALHVPVGIDVFPLYFHHSQKCFASAVSCFGSEEEWGRVRHFMSARKPLECFGKSKGSQLLTCATYLEQVLECATQIKYQYSQQLKHVRVQKQRFSATDTYTFLLLNTAPSSLTTEPHYLSSDTRGLKFLILDTKVLIYTKICSIASSSNNMTRGQATCKLPAMLASNPLLRGCSSSHKLSKSETFLDKHIHVDHWARNHRWIQQDEGLVFLKPSEAATSRDWLEMCSKTTRGAIGNSLTKRDIQVET